jgi:hypothetical protein
MAHKICLGVEICQDNLKIALVEPERKNIIKIDAVPTSGNPVNDASIYASVLGSWMRSSSLLAKVNSVAVAFPSYNVIMRLVTIPKETVNANEYVNWEFASAINSQASDYQLDISFYPNEKKPVRSIVTAIRKKVIESFRSAKLGDSGFKPNHLIADTCALLNLLEYTEGLSSQPKCVLKADEKFVTACWGNTTGPLGVRLLPKDCISPYSVAGILESGYEEFPKTKKKVKFCGELSAKASFTSELIKEAHNLNVPLQIQPWNSLSKFSLEKGADSSKLPQCMGAIGATLNCMWET